MWVVQKTYLRHCGLSVILSLLTLIPGCSSGEPRVANSVPSANAPSQPDPSPPNSPPAATLISGVLQWKGDSSGAGWYGNESRLTPQNVNVKQFGKLATFPVDGLTLAQPLFISQLNMGSLGIHDVVIVATEHDSVYAFDPSGPTTPLWHRSFLDNGATPVPDTYGGRTLLGGEIGITGTPVIDPSTGALYLVTMLKTSSGSIEQWLHAIDVRTGNDYGPAVKIQASVSGDGQGSSNGQIAFDPSVQNQRAGLVLRNGQVLIAWGSFSDWGVYHGWIMAYEASTLLQTAVLNLSTQHQDTDSAYGPADYGGGAAIWQSGAAPSIDANGNIYVVAADGSFNANQGGLNYGDSVVRLTLDSSGFHVTDWFTPSNQACLDAADLEIGSGGVALLPPGAVGSIRAGVVLNKEGRLYLLNLDKLGKYNLAGDTQIPQTFMVGGQQCRDGMGDGYAEGSDWNRLYGNASYWNGNLYLAAANDVLRRYTIANGTIVSSPKETSSNVYGLRGGNTVVSSMGTSGAIVWSQEKAASGQAILHAYDATNVATELWNSQMNAGRDGLGGGISFAVPVVFGGHVFVATADGLTVYGQL